MNVFLREIVAYRKSTLIWMASLAGMVALFMIGMYPAFSSDVEASKQMIGGLPEAVRAAFAISLSNFFTIFGFYAYFLSFATVAGAIQAMNIGAGSIAKEFAGKTADFLISKPVTRPKILTAKLAAALVSVVAVSLAFALAGYVAAQIATSSTGETVTTSTFVLLSLTMLLIQLFFMALGALFAVLIPKIKTAVAVSLPTVFTFFIIGMLGEILGNDKVRYMTPFKFFDSMYIINNTAFESRYLVLEAVLVVVFVAATYVLFQRKDIRAAA
ncbi:MAG: ABC transporter permease [Actinobacteria bacterium]|nr:ABC transporter permease [Actinomycetota bacterium]